MYLCFVLYANSAVANVLTIHVERFQTNLLTGVLSVFVYLNSCYSCVSFMQRDRRTVKECF